MPGSRPWAEDTPGSPLHYQEAGRPQPEERDLASYWERRLPFVLLAILVGMLAYVIWYAL
jgi:hypothetical protein